MVAFFLAALHSMFGKSINVLFPSISSVKRNLGS